MKVATDPVRYRNYLAAIARQKSSLLEPSRHGVEEAFSPNWPARILGHGIEPGTLADVSRHHVLSQTTNPLSVNNVKSARRRPGRGEEETHKSGHDIQAAGRHVMYCQ